MTATASQAPSFDLDRVSVEDMPRRIEDIDDPDVRAERMLGLTSARVVFADYELLYRDFPQLDRAARGDSGRTDAWLLRNAALISEPQAAQAIVNDPIPVKPSDAIACRPPRYGRSAIVAVERHGGDGAGLLDLKGIGVRSGATPAPTVHGHGLLSLDLLLQEVLNQRLVDAVFRHAEAGYRTLPIYAVIDAGFDAREYWTGHDLVRPCGILVRRAHRRERGGVELPPRGSVKQFVLAEIEMLLRQYGLTSANLWSTIELARRADGLVEARLQGEPVTGHSQARLHAMWMQGGAGRWTRFEGVNVQTSRDVFHHRPRAELVDFGHFIVREAFEHPVVSLVSDRPLRWGGVLRPDDPQYPQPHAVMRAPFALWGIQAIQSAAAGLVGLPVDFRLPRSLELAMVLATRWRRGDITGDGVRAALDTHIAATVEQWYDQPVAGD